MSTGNAQATPEMVNQLSGSEEVALNPKTGEVTPLPSQNSADPSQTASTEGAAAEPVSNATETPAQSPEATPPSSTPAPATAAAVHPAPPPAVTVTPTAPVATETAPESTPAIAPVQAEAPKENVADALKVLAEYKDTVMEEARRSVQGAHDRQNTQINRQLEESNTRAKELTAQVRELANRDLTEAERAVAMAKYEQDDERESLNTARAELLVLQKDTYMDSLMLEFTDYGVTRDALEAIETPEEMDIFCLQRKSGHFEAKLRETPAEGATPAPATTPAPVAATAPVEPTPAPAPNVPAGAFAPSDVGGGGIVPEGKQFSQEATPDAMRENLKNMDRVSVGIRQK